MNKDKLLSGKRILVVDDEADVRDTLFELLGMCKIDKAASYNEAKDMLFHETYDIAILDIMGVNGYGLLKIANEKHVPAIMLTAHGLSEENLVKAADEGAVYYAPKEELVNIKEIVIEVIEALENQKSPWKKMVDRLGAFYDRKFNGPDWRKKRREFWEEKRKEHPDTFF